MRKKVNKRQEIFGLCGIVWPFFLLIGVAFSIAISPWFVWTEHCLSHLGVSETLSETIFNYSLIISGILMILLGVGLFSKSKGYVDRIRNFLIILGGIALAGVGIFPWRVEDLHFISAVGFYMIVDLSILIYGIKVSFESRINGAYWIILGLVGPAVFISTYPGLCAIPEAFGFIPISVYSIFMGLDLKESNSFNSSTQ